jgi:hypothetical protein
MPVEFIVGAVVGGAAVSRRVRQAVRKGLIYGVGGALVAFDKMAAMAHAARQSVRPAAAAPENAQATVPVSAAPAPQPAPQTVSVNASVPVGTPS